MKELTFSVASLCLVLASTACSSVSGLPDDGTGGSGPSNSGGNTGVPGAGGGAVLGGGGTTGLPGAGGGSQQGAGGGGVDPGAGGSGGGLNGTGGTGDPGTGGAVAIDLPELVTSGQGAYWQEGSLMQGGTTANVTVNTATKYQTWHGFGGTFNEKGWVALKALSEADRALAIRLLFDRADGAGFTHGRIPIGSSDYGNDRYSLNEEDGDTDMSSFSIDRDKIDLIPYIKAALDVRSDIRFWASPWSPPTWMKDNNAFDKGNMKSDAATLGAHALYLARFVEEYEKEGITLEAIHPQNEPGYSQDYPSCLWSGATMATYIATHLGPLFAERLPDTEIWLGTMSNPNDSNIVSTVMGNQTAKGYVKGIGLQWGMGDGNNPSSYASQYGIPIMQSEHKCGNYPWESGYEQTAPNDHDYAVESWGFFKNWIGKNVNSYMAWNMVLDTVGRSLDTVRPWAQNALLAVDVNAGTLVITPTYYLFRHLSQFVEPGAVRVATQGGDALAFENPDGSIVTMMYNSGGQAAATTLSVGGTMVQFTIPSRGWATVNWKG